MTLKRLCSKAALAAVVAVAVAPVVSQADVLDNGPVSVTVSSRGLDLRTEAGAQAMVTRLAIAAEQACGIEAKFDPLRQGKFEICYRETLANAVRVVNRAHVTQAYVARHTRDASKEGITDSSVAAN